MHLYNHLYMPNLVLIVTTSTSRGLNTAPAAIFDSAQNYSGQHQRPKFPLLSRLIHQACSYYVDRNSLVSLETKNLFVAIQEILAFKLLEIELKAISLYSVSEGTKTGTFCENQPSLFYFLMVFTPLIAHKLTSLVANQRKNNSPIGEFHFLICKY